MKNRGRLGYGIRRVYSRLATVPLPRKISTPVGPDRWISALTLYPRPRERAVEGHRRRVRALKSPPSYWRGGLLRAPITFTVPKIVLPLRKMHQQDTLLIPLTSDPARVEVPLLVLRLQAIVPLIPGSTGAARSLLLRTRCRLIQHLRRQSLPALLRPNKPRSRRNPKHSHPRENFTQHFHQTSSVHRRITNKVDVVRTSYLPLTTLVRLPLRVTLRLLADHLFLSP